jgi:(p)ppGpp synthase/HD superfamily hydrolase
MIQGTFGGRIAEMVDMLTRDRPDGSKLSVEQVLNNAYHLKDKEVLLIKLFDRLHNIQTIGSMNIDKMEKIINETLINFVLLSEYLELTSTAKKVQELCLEVCKCLNPEEKPYINIFSFNDNYQPLSLIYQND